MFGRSMRASQRLAGGVVAVSLAAALVAVGSASAKGSGAKAPITVMAMASVNSPIDNDPALWAGAKAAAAAINKAGGINGHDVRVLTCNTNSDPNQTEACTRQAIQSHAVAVVGDRDGFTNLSVPLLANAGIPDIGLYSTGNPIDGKNPDIYPLVSGDPGQYRAAVLIAKKLGKLRLAGLAADIPAAIQDADSAKAVAKRVGVTYVGTVVVPDTGVVDYSPYAQKLKDLNSNAVVSVMSPDAEIGVLKAVQAIGKTEQYFNVPEAFGPNEAAQANGLGNGMVEAAPFPAVSSTSYPLIKTFDAQMKAFGVNPVTASATKYPYWVTGINSWLSVWAVAKLGHEVSGTLTAHALKAQLAKTKSVTLPGGFTWNPSAKGPKGYPRMGNWKMYALQIKHGQLTTLPIGPLNVESYVH